MDIDTTQKSNRALAIIGLLILGLIAGALVAGLYYKGKAKQAETACAKQAADLKKSSTSGMPNIPKVPVPSEVTSISGTVEKIEGQTITLKAFFFGEQKTFAVTAGDATKIQKREMKKELPKPEEGKPMEPFTLTDAKLGDIRQGDNLNVEASENIKDKTSFVAKTIYIEIMNLPAPSELPKVDNLPTPPAIPTPPASGSLPAPSTAVPAPPTLPEMPK